MLRRNVHTSPHEPVVAHGGRGRIAFLRPFGGDEFETALSFIDHVELPPGTSIGVHRHGDDEEVYFIVRGTGVMTTNGRRFAVAAGDLVVNRRGWSHGLENDGSEPLEVLVWEIGYRP